MLSDWGKSPTAVFPATPPTSENGGGRLLSLLRGLDPLTVASAPIKAEFAQSRRPWGVSLVLLWAASAATYWGVLWVQDLARPDVVTWSTQPAAAAPHSAFFTPSELLVGNGIVTTFLPADADAASPCYQSQLANITGGVALPPTGATVPLCPAEAGRHLGAPNTDAGGVAFLMQLALPCPPHQGVDSFTYVNGMLLSDLLEYHGLPNTTRLGTITYGASTVPLYARSVQARVCVPPAVASRARLLPRSGVLADTARVPMASLQLRLRRTAFSNGTTVEDVASATVQARESDIWDVTGGDASIDAQVWSVPAGYSKYNTASFPAIPQLRRRGNYITSTVFISTSVLSAAVAEAQLLSSMVNNALIPLLGSSYPLTLANAERLGNWTIRWGYGHYSTPVNTSFITTYVGEDACVIFDSMQLDYVPMSVATAPSMYGTLDYQYNTMDGSVSTTLTSALPTLQAQNAASRLQCGLKWQQRTPAARECRFVQSVAQSIYVDNTLTNKYGTKLLTFASTIEDDAFVGCTSGVTLPTPLADTVIPAWSEDDIGERVLDHLGRPFPIPVPFRLHYNVTSGNLCMSGGACLYTTHAPVQTVLVLLSAAPQQDNGVYISTRQGGLAVFSQAAAVFGLMWSLVKYAKMGGLMLERRIRCKRRPVKDTQ